MKVYFGHCFDFLICVAYNLKVKLLCGKILRFSKMFFEIWGANISKNNIRGEVALAFLGLIFIALLRNIDFTKNVDGNILEIILLLFWKKTEYIFFLLVFCTDERFIQSLLVSLLCKFVLQQLLFEGTSQVCF